MRWQENDGGVRTWHFAMDGPDVLAAISTRHGGVSTGPYNSLNLGFHVADEPARVSENRRRLCVAVGVAQLTVPDQQHRNRVVLVDESLSGAGHGSLVDAERRLGSTDALVTELPGVALTIMVADCAPVVMHDPVHRSLGVAHVGRGGAVSDVLGATVAVMSEAFGTVPSDLEVGIGPCIGLGHYEIGGVQLEQTREAFGDPSLFRPTSPGHACFDLLAAVRLRLVQAGIKDDRIEATGVDTYASGQDFFSDRATRPCGRFMLVASLR